jgi:hypothetical protein
LAVTIAEFLYPGTFDQVDSVAHDLTHRSDCL